MHFTDIIAGTAKIGHGQGQEESESKETSKACRLIFRARDEEGMWHGSDRVGVTMRLLAWMGNRQKTGLGEYEQTDSFPGLV